MRFNIRTSNYSRAGKAAADEVVNIHAAARRNSPDYGKMVQLVADIRSAVKRAGISAAADVSVAGINAAAKVEGNKIVGKAKRGLKKEQRKAGALGLAGKFFSNAGALAGEKRDKREVGGEDEFFKTEMARIEQRTKDLQTKLEQSQSGATNTSTESTPSSTDSGTGSKISTNTTGTVNPSGYSKQWKALQTVIRSVEGTSGDKGYTTRFGGHQFEGFDVHPNIGEKTPWGTTSEAAGAFQFMKPTWDEAKAALNLPDFSPASQQKAGRFLTERRGVNPDADLSDYNTFVSSISKLSPEWAGLPNTANGRSGYHGQANADMKELHELYLSTLQSL